METAVFDTKPLLRPDQLQIAKEEISSLEAKLSNPLIQDKGEVYKQLQRAKKATDEQTPLAPKDVEEEGRMVKRADELLAKILEGMPSKEEMRKSPPGAIDKHMKWERANKKRIEEWKNLRLRLTAGSGDREVANLERYRPTRSTLNMDTTFVVGKNFFMPETTGPSVVFSDAQLEVLRKLSPQLADSLALMTNPERAEVKDAIAGIGLEVAPKPKNKGGRPKKLQAA